MILLQRYVIRESKDSYTAGLRYLGNFDFSDFRGPRFISLTGTVLARFYGSRVSFRLKSFGNSTFTIFIDNKVYMESLSVKDEDKLTEVIELSEGIHEIKITIASKDSRGIAQFLGFNFEDGYVLIPGIEKMKEII